MDGKGQRDLILFPLPGGMLSYRAERELQFGFATDAAYNQLSWSILLMWFTRGKKQHSR